MLYVQIAAGFVLLFFGAESMVRGAVAVARWFEVSTMVIGMTVIAFGTSAPELIVALDAAVAGSPGIALGNVVGSNIANVLLILGVAGLLVPIAVNRTGFYHDSAVLLGGSLLFAALCLMGVIGLWSGVALLAAFAVFIGYTFWRETHGLNPAAGNIEKEVEEKQAPGAQWLAWVLVVAGLGALLWGADMLVDGGVSIARVFGVPEEVLGLTLIALGTSLPELAASVVAAYRGHFDVALGNVLGSNLFNILGIAGTVAVVTPLPVPDQILRFDLWIMVAVSVVIIPLLSSGWRLDRGEAALLLAAYIGYIGCQAYGVQTLLDLIA